jgi:mannitol-1-phosphate 5-dehydrogenase
MRDAGHVFVGFGFGPIQSGLFAKEAADSGRFGEIVVAEVDPSLVAAVRGNGDRYVVNVAFADRVEAVTVEGVRLLNPNDPRDAEALRGALGRATEMVTSLPSVDIYARGGANAVSRLIADGLSQTEGHRQTVVYTAENNNHAAEILEKAVAAAGEDRMMRPFQMLNTVIGKMSQVISDAGEIARRRLAPVVPGYPRAFLVEAFNRILVSRIALPEFCPGITAFEEKADLLPFEEAKLYGHNAAHTMLGFLGMRCGARLLSDMRAHPESMRRVRRAFLEESGAALIATHGKLGDPLFTPEGFRAYVDDLLERMTNPWLADTVARAIRDPLRKLGASDRLFGAIRLCLARGIEPVCLAAGALAGLAVWAAEREGGGETGGARCDAAAFEGLLHELWGEKVPADERSRIAALLARAQNQNEAGKDRP